MVRPRFLEFVILPFAYLFQPIMMPLLFLSVGVFLPHLEQSQRTHLNVKGFILPSDYDEGEYVSYLAKPAFITTQYLF